MLDKPSLHNSAPTDDVSSHQARLEHDIETAADIIIRRTTIHLGSVQNIAVSKKSPERDIMAEAIKFLAFELYHRKVSVKIVDNPSRPNTTRFIIDCEQSNFAMQVFPVLTK